MSRQPRIWVLLGHRTGDNNQLLALAEALALPFETRTVRFNLLRLFRPIIGNSSWSLTRTSRRTISAPWPDLVIGIGWRSVTVAQWIRRQSGGRARIVRLGDPRSDPALFDLVITTPQYPVAEGPNVLRLPIGLSRFKVAPTPTEAEREYLDNLPRPHRLFAIGGPAKFWRLTVDRVREALLDLAERDGTAIAVTSPRTPPDILGAVEDLGRPNVRVVTGRHPRFPVLLADADEVYVTGDSIAMLSEAVLAGKPVGIVPIEPDPRRRRALDRHSSRDLRRFWASLQHHGLAGTLQAPVRGNIEDPAMAAAAAVRALLGDGVE